MTVQLGVFADESGIGTSASYCLVLGFIGSLRQWTNFEQGWREVIDNHKITEFHAKEFFGRDKHGRRVGQYNGWTSMQAHGFLEGLISVARKCHLNPIGGAVDVSAFNSLTLGERRFLTGGNIWESGKWKTSGAPSKPYYLAMNLLVVEALERADTDAELHFIFDEQNELQPRAIQTFQETVGLGPFAGKLRIGQIKSIAFSRSIDEEGLQLADMHSYAWNRYLVRGQTIDENIRLILEAFLPKKVKPGVRVFNRIGLQIVLNNLPKHLREKLQNDS